MAVPKNTRYTDTAGRETELNDLATQLNHTAWQRRACGIGSKGFRVYDWALIDIRRHRPPIHDPHDQSTTVNSPSTTATTRATPDSVNSSNVAGARWPIEECFGAGKNEVGLDEYQVRKYDAWHRHITLAMLAHSFLAITAHKAKKGGPNKPAD